jgi:hypothetical protein
MSAALSQSLAQYIEALHIRVCPDIQKRVWFHNDNARASLIGAEPNTSFLICSYSMQLPTSAVSCPFAAGFITTLAYPHNALMPLPTSSFYSSCAVASLSSRHTPRIHLSFFLYAFLFLDYAFLLIDRPARISRYLLSAYLSFVISCLVVLRPTSSAPHHKVSSLD